MANFPTSVKNFTSIRPIVKQTLSLAGVYDALTGEVTALATKLLDSASPIFAGNYYKDSDVAHGITALNLTTSTFGLIQINDGTGGGLDITGASDSAGISGLTMRGIIGVADPTDTIPAVSLIGGKANGAGWQALGAAETVLQVTNYTTALVTVLGDGKFGIGKSSSMLASLHVEKSAGMAAFFGNSGSLDNSYVSGNTINADYYTNSDGSELWLNYAGYQNGATRYRNTVIGNGKNGALCTFTGSTGAINIASGGVLQHNGTTLNGYITSGVTGFATDAAIRLKVLNIGDWDMDSTASVSVAHGMTLSKVVKFWARIIDDSGNYVDIINGPLENSGDTAIFMDPTNIVVERKAGSLFDAVGYDATSYNRGHIFIQYVD